MNKVITIGSFVLAVPAFIYIFYQDKKMVIIAAICTLFFCCILFFLENHYKDKWNEVINHFVFLFTRSDMYYVDQKRVEYERLDEINWKQTKTYKLISKTKDFDEYTDRYSWSADATGAELKAVDSKHTIGNKGYDGNWNTYTVRFEKTYGKNQEVESGSILTNLVDEKNMVRPFLSLRVDRKTRLLKMTVFLPLAHSPVNACLHICDATDREMVCPQRLQICKNGTRFEITHKVLYPRVGWIYKITWE